MADARIDRGSGVIKGVSLVSVGEARGYNQWADRKTLDQVMQCAKQYTGGLRVKFNPNTFNHGDGSLAGRIPGESLRVIGNAGEEQLIGDLKVYEHLASKEYLFEIAESAPDNCGLSIHFGGVPEEVDGKTYARCEEIFDATVVDLPAANRRGLFKAGDQPNESMTMTDDDVKKLGTAFATAVQPIIEKENAKVIAAFRSSQGQTDDGSPPSAEEASAAGCTDEMSPEEKAAKVSAWRKSTGDQPVTMKGLMAFFRMTGGKPARVSGDGEGAPGEATGGFEKLVVKYRATGMGAGKAIRRAAQDDGKGYGEWVQNGRPNIK